MKKILHVITGLEDGGAEAVLYRLCSFDKEHIHIVVSLMGKGKYGPLLENSGVVVHCLDMSAGTINIKGLIRLYKLVRYVKPDVVQTWMFHADLIGGVISRLAGIKNIVWGVHHTTLLKGESKRSTIIIAKLNSFLSYFVPKKIIYCANESRKEQEAIGYSSKIGCVVPNGFNINDFTPNSSIGNKFRQELKLLNDVFLIGHVGRYDPLKDHQTLLMAISELKSLKSGFEVILVGTGLDDSNSTLKNFVESNNLSGIKMLGRRNDIPSIMNACDVFVLSSVSEAFPNVLNEAMACGTPCIATDVGDVSNIIADTGWIVPPKSPRDIAQSIYEAIDEKNNNALEWKMRKQACRQRIVDNFNIDKMVFSYHKIWFY